MDTAAIRAWIERNAELSFTHSCGPGGQNVNKTSTATLCHVDLNALEGVSDFERIRLFEALKNRVNHEGKLVVKAQDTRSQLGNKELVVERACTLVLAALHVDPPRHKTKPTRASRERRLTAKKISSSKKSLRSNSFDRD